MPTTFFFKMFAKISGQLFADTGIAFKKANHIVYSLNLKAFLFFKQSIHFFRHIIDIKCLGQNVVHFYCLFGLELDPAFLIKVFQCGQNPLPIRIITVKDCRDIDLCPNFPGMTMIYDRGNKLFSFPFKTADDFCRLCLILERIFFKIGQLGSNNFFHRQVNQQRF